MIATQCVEPVRIDLQLDESRTSFASGRLQFGNRFGPAVGYGTSHHRKLTNRMLASRDLVLDWRHECHRDAAGWHALPPSRTSITMPFPVASRHVEAAESKLGCRFPASYRSRMMASNGGELELAGEPWCLHPVLDDSDTERLRRSWDDVVRQTQLARSWRNFPANAVSLADNGCGDRLLLLPASSRESTPALARWDHESGTVELIAGGFEAVFGPS